MVLWESGSFYCFMWKSSNLVYFMVQYGAGAPYSNQKKGKGMEEEHETHLLFKDAYQKLHISFILISQNHYYYTTT